MRHLRTLRYIDAVARTGSIRRAAEDLALDASALNRRIQDFEEELGTPIFERLPRGVRLNAAGELLIRHARAQLADLERVRSQIADLSGVRRGRVAIAASQAAAYALLPGTVSAYTRAFPSVTFEVLVRDHVGAQKALVDFTADLILVFEPAPQTELQILHVVEQPLYVVMAQGHPLAARETLRLREILEHPLALPDRSFGGRALFEQALARRSLRVVPTVESNSFEFLRAYVRREQALTIQLAVGAPGAIAALGDGAGFAARPIDPRDIAPGRLVLGQLRGRTLPVAAAKFADLLVQRLERLGAHEPPDA